MRKFLEILAFGLSFIGFCLFLIGTLAIAFSFVEANTFTLVLYVILVGLNAFFLYDSLIVLIRRECKLQRTKDMGQNYVFNVSLNQDEAEEFKKQVILAASHQHATVVEDDNIEGEEQ